MAVGGAGPGPGKEKGEPKPDGEGLDGLAEYLKVLGNTKRLHLLSYLATPHYIEEIASELKMARQTAQEHVQRLLDIGVIQRVRGRRDSGPVTEYVVVPQRLFSIHEELGKVGVLEPELGEEALAFRPPTSPLATGAPAPREHDLPRLVLVHGFRIGATTALQGEGPWLVGRDPAAAVCLDYDPFVSTRHAEVRRIPGGFEVADLYSSNGTFLDWKRLPRGNKQALDNGAVVRVGRSILVFRKPA